jgi:FkbM family methyltransferase
MPSTAPALLRAIGTAMPINPVVDGLYQRLIPLTTSVPINSVVTTAEGLRFRVFSERPKTLLNNPDYYIYYFDIWEPRPTRVLRRLIRAGDVCFDLGANIGWYTLLLSHLVGHAGQVHAFEPDPRAFRRLRENVALNRCAENVRLNELAVGRDTGTAQLCGVDESLYTSLYEIHASKSFGHKVDIQSIDAYVSSCGLQCVDFMKCDVEGSEFDVFRGAQGVLRDMDRPPMIQLEVNPGTAAKAGFTPLELLRWLPEQRDYHFYRITLRGDLIELSSLMDAASHLTDIYCLVPDLHMPRLVRASEHRRSTRG